MMICWIKLDTPFMLSPLRNTPITNAPMAVPETVPTPPISDVPPMTALAIASSSYITPSFGCAVTRRDISTHPAIPASKPDSTYVNSFTPCTFTPDKRAASAFEPTA